MRTMKRRGMETEPRLSEQCARRKRRRGATTNGENDQNSAEADEQEHEASEAHDADSEQDPADEDEDEDEDRDAGGTDDQAGHPAAAGAPDLAAAAQQLSRLTGLPVEAAANALRETQDKVQTGNGAGSAALLQNWLEEAQIWLACNMEVQVEIDEVRAAMQESLQAYEAAKAADNMPLPERPPDYLRDHFLAAARGSTGAFVPRSEVFTRVSAFACHRALFADGGHKAPLVKLAELESKCRRWYPNKGTGRFWEQLAAECTSQAAAAAPAGPPFGQEGWVGCAQGPDACTTCAAALGRCNSSDAGPSTSAPAAAAASSRKAPAPRRALAPAEAEAVLAALGSFAAQKAGTIEREVCRMPTVSGQVPDLFASLDDPPGEGGHSDAEEIVVLEACRGAADKQGVDEVEL